MVWSKGLFDFNGTSQDHTALLKTFHAKSYTHIESEKIVNIYVNNIPYKKSQSTPFTINNRVKMCTQDSKHGCISFSSPRTFVRALWPLFCTIR